MDNTDYYRVLGLQPGATAAEIKAAYRELAKRWHPDLHSDPQLKQQAEMELKKINIAYDHLKDIGAETPADASTSPRSSQTPAQPVTVNKPATAVGFYELGQEQVQQGRFTDALESFTQAIKLNPKYGDAYYLRAEVCKQLGYENRAASDLNNAQSLGSKFIQTQTKPAPQQAESSAQPKISVNQVTLENISFSTVTVDKFGQIINREKKRTRSFTENLGNGVLLEMVEIPAGEFLMGSPASEPLHRSDEGPQHLVNVPRFFMGRFTVTRAQWRQVMGNNSANFKGEQRPVVQINWHDAQEFCKKLSWQTGRRYRLPSEAEWEYACRAGTTTPFHFGPTITPELVNYDGNTTPFHFGLKITPDLVNDEGNHPYGSAAEGKYRQETTPVGSFPANGFGLHDMHGNVYEWCEDLWNNSYQGAPTDGSTWVTGGDASFRLLRGGSWNNSAQYCLSANRYRREPADRYYDLGLRLVCSA